MKYRPTDFYMLSVLYVRVSYTYSYNLEIYVLSIPGIKHLLYPVLIFLPNFRDIAC